MRKPSVTFFNRVYPPERGATGRMVRDLARAFVRDGWNVTVVTTGPQAGRDREGAIRIVRVKSRGKSVFAYASGWIKMLWKGFRLPASDLVITMTDPPLFACAGRLLQKFRGVKHVHWCQDVYPDLFPVLGYRFPYKLLNVAERLSCRAMKSCDKVVAIGRCMAKTLRNKGIRAGRITVIPNWANEELIEKSPDGSKPGGPEAMEQSAREREEFYSNDIQVDGARPPNQLRRTVDPKFRVLYAGSLGRAHPLRTIVEAARILDKRNPEIEFVFVGDGPQFDWLAREREKLSMENIRFLPWQPESRLRDLMESGDVHIISMRDGTEGLLMPCKLYSALAVGRPCIFIGPEETEAVKVIHDFGAGKVIEQGDAEALAEAVRTYRLDSKAWFSTHEGAAEAGRVFVPQESYDVWTSRMRTLVGLDNSGGKGGEQIKKAA